MMSFQYLHSGFAFDTMGGDRPGDHAVDGDIFAARFTDAVLSLLDPFEGELDLPDQVPLSVPNAQGKHLIGIKRGLIQKIGQTLPGISEVEYRIIGPPVEFVEPVGQQLPEVLNVFFFHIDHPSNHEGGKESWKGNGVLTKNLAYLMPEHLKNRFFKINVNPEKSISALRIPATIPVSVALDCYPCPKAVRVKADSWPGPG